MHPHLSPGGPFPELAFSHRAFTQCSPCPWTPIHPSSLLQVFLCARTGDTLIDCEYLGESPIMCRSVRPGGQMDDKRQWVMALCGSAFAWQCSQNRHFGLRFRALGVWDNYKQIGHFDCISKCCTWTIASCDDLMKSRENVITSLPIIITVILFECIWIVKNRGMMKKRRLHEGSWFWLKCWKGEILVFKIKTPSKMLLNLRLFGL